MNFLLLNPIHYLYPYSTIDVAFCAGAETTPMVEPLRKLSRHFDPSPSSQIRWIRRDCPVSLCRFHNFSLDAEGDYTSALRRRIFQDKTVGIYFQFLRTLSSVYFLSLPRPTCIWAVPRATFGIKSIFDRWFKPWCMARLLALGLSFSAPPVDIRRRQK